MANLLAPVAATTKLPITPNVIGIVPPITPRTTHIDVPGVITVAVQLVLIAVEVVVATVVRAAISVVVVVETALVAIAGIVIVVVAIVTVVVVIVTVVVVGGCHKFLCCWV